jgi:hypothetical protein
MYVSGRIACWATDDLGPERTGHFHACHGDGAVARPALGAEHYPEDVVSERSVDVGIFGEIADQGRPLGRIGQNPKDVDHSSEVPMCDLGTVT